MSGLQHLFMHSYLQKAVIHYMLIKNSLAVKKVLGQSEAAL